MMRLKCSRRVEQVQTSKSLLASRRAEQSDTDALIKRTGPRVGRAVAYVQQRWAEVNSVCCIVVTGLKHDGFGGEPAMTLSVASYEGRESHVTATWPAFW